MLFRLNYDNTSLIVEALDDLFMSLDRSIDLLESKDIGGRSVQMLRDRQRSVGALLCEIRPKFTLLASERIAEKSKPQPRPYTTNPR
jgi:hypothetical protein